MWLFSSYILQLAKSAAWFWTGNTCGSRLLLETTAMGALRVHKKQISRSYKSKTISREVLKPSTELEGSV